MMNTDIILAPLQVLDYTGSSPLYHSLAYNIQGGLPPSTMNADMPCRSLWRSSGASGQAQEGA